MKYKLDENADNHREGRLEVGSSDDSILVVVNDTESLLELLDLLLAEK